MSPGGDTARPSGQIRSSRAHVVVLARHPEPPGLSHGPFWRGSRPLAQRRRPAVGKRHRQSASSTTARTGTTRYQHAPGLRSALGALLPLSIDRSHAAVGIECETEDFRVSQQPPWVGGVAADCRRRHGEGSTPGDLRPLGGPTLPASSRPESIGCARTKMSCGDRGRRTLPRPGSMSGRR